MLFITIYAASNVVCVESNVPIVLSKVVTTATPSPTSASETGNCNPPDSDARPFAIFIEFCCRNESVPRPNPPAFSNNNSSPAFVPSPSVQFNKKNPPSLSAT